MRSRMVRGRVFGESQLSSKTFARANGSPPVIPSPKVAAFEGAEARARVLITVPRGGIKNKKMRRCSTRRNVRFNDVVGKLRAMRTIFHEINRDGGSWAFADERGRNASEGACTFKHVRKGERAKEKAQEEMRKEKERERGGRGV